MTASILLMWTLGGLWVWLSLVRAMGGRAGYAWALVAASFLSGPAVWIIILFWLWHGVGSVFPNVAPRARVKVPRRPAPNRDWFTPQGTSRN